jgi:hypothetical protein
MHTEWSGQNATIFGAFRPVYLAPPSGLLRRHAAFQAAGARRVRGLQIHIKTLSLWLAASPTKPLAFRSRTDPNFILRRRNYRTDRDTGAHTMHSRNDVWRELVLNKGDAVAQQQFALFQSLHLDEI